MIFSLILISNLKYFQNYFYYNRQNAEARRIKKAIKMNENIIIFKDCSKKFLDQVQILSK